MGDDVVQFTCDVQSLVGDRATRLLFLLALECLGPLLECLDPLLAVLEVEPEHEHRGEERQVECEAAGIQP